tara:strand:- start:155 stop:640 length:486 start_codon:yes stop_codon:yes gene_type:complete
MTHTEAPSSINFKGKTSVGWEVMFTLRDDSEAMLLERFRILAGILLENGIEPTGKTASPPTFSAPNGAPPTTPAQVVATESETETFAASSLVCSINDGTTYYKVQGGPFIKFGVTVWSEVIGTIFDLDQLDPTQTYDLTGYTATYLRVDGKPKKVTALTKT